jgi:hypothetical protein
VATQIRISAGQAALALYRNGDRLGLILGASSPSASPGGARIKTMMLAAPGLVVKCAGSPPTLVKGGLAISGSTPALRRCPSMATCTLVEQGARRCQVIAADLGADHRSARESGNSPPNRLTALECARTDAARTT